MSIEKKYLKKRPACKVKFIAPAPILDGAKSVFLAGDFNSWDFEATKLKKQKDGSYATTLELEPGSEYAYRYVVDGERWENDWDADKYTPSGLGTDNSVVIV